MVYLALAFLFDIDAMTPFSHAQGSPSPSNQLVDGGPLGGGGTGQFSHVKDVINKLTAASKLIKHNLISFSLLWLFSLATLD